MEASLRPLLSRTQIDEKLSKIAKQVSQDFQNKDLVIVMVLKGAICIAADLIRKLTIPFVLEWIQCSSYGSGGTRRKEIELTGLEHLHLDGKDVLIVDDTFDSGATLNFLFRAFQQKKAKTIRSLVLLKKKVPRDASYEPDYFLFETGEKFVVGYGLDYKEQYRGLDHISILETID